MTTVDLVHGAMHGGWCWRRMSPLLRDAGHEVFMPTLTGLSERADHVHTGHSRTRADATLSFRVHVRTF